VERTIHDQIWPRVKRCYQAALQVDPKQQGRLVILIKVDASGTVNDASIGANAGLSDAVAACAVDAARAARFPPPGPGGSKIAVPFNLVLQQPGQSSAAAPRPRDPATDEVMAADPIVPHIQAMRERLPRSTTPPAPRETASTSPSTSSTGCSSPPKGCGETCSGTDPPPRPRSPHHAALLRAHGTAGRCRR
jgi:TonB family protein